MRSTTKSSAAEIEGKPNRIAALNQNPYPWLRRADLGGTFVFAVEGAMAGIAASLDLFGVLVLSFVTALGGGIVRDLLIGAAPPAAIRDWRYATTAFSGGALAFLLYQVLRQVPHPVLVGLDAAGLALFAVAGTAKALDYHLNPLSVALMGTITGAGGGVVRDIFLAQIPAVLQVEIYATAAMAGSVLMILGVRLGRSRKWMMVLGALLTFLIRVVAVWQHWNLPKVVHS
ncbi:MAG TPA: trimeric intracellular cation channel family protein [Thermoanaerobaculia bacterium]|nr:trimeric intracellular cation channel family protein [Thermoanaerobaculia bacterium]